MSNEEIAPRRRIGHLPSARRTGLSFGGLILHNLWTRKARSVFTTIALLLAVSSVVTLGILTESLASSALAVLRTGKADFTIAQKGAADLLTSSLDRADLDAVRTYPGIASAVGVFLQVEKLDPDHPLFILIGIPPEDLTPFGVRVVTGVPYTDTAPTSLMLGYRAARDFDKHVGDDFRISGTTYRITGIYSLGNVFGDSAAMLPLPTLQAYERQPGAITSIFVRVQPGTNIDALRRRIEHDHPQLATVRTQAEFGRVDRNLALIEAGNTGASYLALAIGAVVVMNTALLTFFERTRELGVLRAIGWSQPRLFTMVMGEIFVLALVGASLGSAVGVAGVFLLEHVSSLFGVFHATFSAGIFWRALYVSAGMAFLGAFYPAFRAVRLSPLDAMHHE
jgi:putative ABC transport system permease protein